MKKIPLEFRPLSRIIITFLLLILLVFFIGLIVDYYRKDKYKVNKIYYRTLSHNVGGGEEYYYRYWAWQPNKKKFYERILLENHGITRTYTRKAMKKKQLKKSIIPFRREIYGKAK